MENLTAVQAIQDISSNWRSFPNTTLAGKYEFLTQTVSADSVEMKHVLELEKNPLNPELLRKTYSVFIHELTHWLDHTSTLWGQSNLITIFNAIHAFENQSESDLWRVPKLFSEIGKIHFADYYHLQGPAASLPWDRKPWQYQFSCGLQYGSDGRPCKDRPIFFTLFENYKGTLISRVPLSVASLLETNAIAAEFMLERLLIVPAMKKHMSEDEFLIESHLLSAKFNENLYNPNLTVYSVATHCLANHLGIDEIFTAYELSSALATLCLNLPNQVFDNLQIPIDIQEQLGERALHLITQRDRGFAFYLLSRYGSNINYSNLPDWLEATIRAAGLPTITKLKELATQEMLDLKQHILKGPELIELSVLLELGKENFQKKEIYGNHDLCIRTLCLGDRSLRLPPILLGDSAIWDVEVTGEKPPRTYEELESWVFHIWDIEGRLREFQKACFA